jgi:hypothetical protein
MDVPVVAVGRRPLLATSLLSQKRLAIDFEEDGLVTVDDLP